MKAKINKHFSLLLIVFIALFAILISTSTESAYADVYGSYSYETIYGDGIYGASTEEDASYNVYCDSAKVVEDVSHYSAPAYKNANSGLTNACGPITGTNVLGFYDRWYENLIPNFTPGLFRQEDKYLYLPTTTSAVNSAMLDLGNLMKTIELGGTTSSNFKNGLKTYVNNQGYSFSYDSFYSTQKTVNFDKLISAVNEGKVGVLMCSDYNFVSGITPLDGYVKVGKFISSYNHMLMVYGYEVIEYYSNGTVIRRDTFLKVSNGSNSGVTGYLQLEDYLTIDEAIIININ